MKKLILIACLLAILAKAETTNGIILISSTAYYGVMCFTNPAFTNYQPTEPCTAQRDAHGACTNLVIDSTYKGTIQVGTNLFKLHSETSTNYSLLPI